MLKDHTATWESCLRVIKDNISLQAYKVWFEPIIPLKLEINILTIQVPSHFFYEWLEQHYIGLLSKVIKKEVGAEGSLEYSIVMESNHRNSTPYTVKLPTQNNTHSQNSPQNIPIGATEPQIRNPFIIPGLKKVTIDGVGLGKTHLAHAIGLSIKEQHPNKTVLYVQSEKFAHQFIDAIKNQTTNDFIHFYQMVDVLIIDDVQFFAGKERTQDVFFSIFNHLHQNGKQIVLTSDKAPVEMQGMEQRLLSRFKWGLSADLNVPDLETRIAILEKKMYASGIELPKEVVEYLAYSINTNIREIEGAMNTLLMQSSLNKKSISLELAKQMVDKFVKNTAREVSIEYIQKIVCDYFDLPIEMLKSKTRKREVVQARQISMYFSKKMTKSSLANIGAHCGGKDHATVLHACRTVVNLSETDKQFRLYLEELEKKLTIH